jgi:chromate reductase
MRILGISGSLRAGSHNTALLRAAASRLDDDVEVEILDGLREVPPYDADDDREPAHPAVARLRDAIREADAVLFATPEYNASIPGVLKNAVDWASRPLPDNALRGTPVAVIGATPGGFGAVWAQAELRKVLGTAGARVLEDGVAVPRVHERIGADGELADEGVLRKLDTVLEALVREVEASLGHAPAASAA